MRILAFLFISTISIISHAGCTDIASLRNDTISIDISDGGCSTSEVMVSFATKRPQDQKFKDFREISFSSECKFRKDGFECSSTGKTPLAGAKYKKIMFGRSSNACDEKGALGLKYICIKGCEIAPEYLNGSDGSC